MNIKGIFFSLRWKLAILFGSAFLILHSVFSYFSYLDAIDSFEIERKKIQNNHIDIAKALIEDSFLMLEQFGELLSLIDLLSSYDKSRYQALSVVDETISKWQFSWDMENVTFFDKQARPVRSWGSQQVVANSVVKRVLRNEEPAHQIFCPHTCFQQTVTPVMMGSETTGAFSVIRSFADVIIKYKNATHSDIGLLITDEASDGHQWPYKLSGMTLPEKNIPVFDYISRNFTIDELLDHSKTIKLDNSIFEIRVFPVPKETEEEGGAGSPFFLFVDDITADFRGFNEDLKHLWFQSIISFLVSLILLMVVLHLSLRRVTQLAQALPLLSRNQYEEFKKRIAVKTISSFFGYDELDKLNSTALTLSDQLEHLEREVRVNTLKLLEKSQALGKERDFIRQLVEVAPIIIITQKLNGMILTINQAGVDEFEADSRSIIGKVFDAFVPESDKEHLSKLNQLRAGERSGRFQIDGLLLTESGKLLNVSWLHTFLKSNDDNNEAVILTLGVDISACKIAEEKSLRLSTHDYLTGLSNRRKFQEELASTLSLAQRYDYQIALIYMGLDQFKAVNDSSGYDVGDQLLVRIARELKNALRSTDLLFRIEGSEFALVVPYEDLEGIECIAKKINKILMGLSFGFVEKSYELSASLGIAIFPRHGVTPGELLANASLAMCQAKAAGRGRYHIFSPNLDYSIKVNRMLNWREVLEDAIANDKFALLYQPILDIKTNTISHYECLVRLRQDDGQLIMTADFIAHAEELGLSGQIDRLVLKKVMQKHMEYERQGQDYKLMVNLSGQSLNDPMFFDGISRLLSMPGVNPARIIFEITETTVFSNFAATKILIDRVRALGPVFALDNLGADFSSFYYLRHFPIDYVKIDGSFIRQIDKREDNKIFVKALAGIAHTFGKKIVAEFTENEAILTILKEFGIDYAQGYYIGRPRRG